MDYLLVTIKLVIAIALSGLIGYEREKRKDVRGVAGLRTHMLVALGACLLTILSFSFVENYGDFADPGRIVSYIILGVGFIGAGTVMSIKNRVVGLTTAASIWLVSAIGISVALGVYIPAIVTTILALIILELWRFEDGA